MYRDKEKRREYQKQYFQKNKERHNQETQARRVARVNWLFEIKKTYKCELCGESHPACLEFHHRNPEDKRGEVCQMASEALSEESILNEIAKCNIWCSNCHQKFHWEERQLNGNSRLHSETAAI